jgi:DNA-binding beta-propeller fold protein YncE
MRKRFITQSVIGAVALLALGLLGAVPASQAATAVKFIATDEPGPWFKCAATTGTGGGPGCLEAGSKSLAILHPGDTVQIDMGSGTTNNTTDSTNTVHTFTSLLYPTGAFAEPYDQPAAFRGSLSPFTLNDPGLYVFVCKLHPFMLGAVIVDNPATTGLDLGNTNGPSATHFNLHLISSGGIDVPASSDLATRLLRAFFLITNPANYQDRSVDGSTWQIDYPDPVLIKVAPGAGTTGAVNLKTELTTRYPAIMLEGGFINLGVKGVGEVWIDTEYEKTNDRSKPGTVTAVDTSTWKVTKKLALPALGIDMNNPHNMWANRDQTVIYQTQWFSNKLTAFNREAPFNVVANITVGDSAAHVMTRVDTDQVHVSINGGGEVVELSPLLASINRHIRTQNDASELQAQPHAHWMSHNGKIMVTPNSNTGDSTRIHIPTGTIKAKTPTGLLPIATGMMPDASKYYVSNYLDSTITCISIEGKRCKDGHKHVAKKDIPLLLAGVGQPWANYNHIDVTVKGMSESGALPIQTPVSPNGKYVVTANTLSGTISIIDTDTDELVKVLPCSAGCHGVNFGAKDGGGYLVYVSSKFSNDLLIVDPDKNNDGNPSDAEIAGRVILVEDVGTTAKDYASVTHYAGMGGQGVLPVPNVYNGWVQNLPDTWKGQLTKAQRHPFPFHKDK